MPLDIGLGRRENEVALCSQKFGRPVEIREVEVLDISHCSRNINLQISPSLFSYSARLGRVSQFRLSNHPIFKIGFVAEWQWKVWWMSIGEPPSWRFQSFRSAFPAFRHRSP
jgi:hypothetical protein